MNSVSTNARAENLPGEHLPGSAPREKSSPRRRFFLLIILIFIAHVALIFIFGTRKPITPVAVKNVPHLELADNKSEFIALENPTLFALPNPKDFASPVWLKIPVVAQPSFRWSEAPGWLPPATENFGATFGEFVRTNDFAKTETDFRPEARVAGSFLPIEVAGPKNSTLQIWGELARRELPGDLILPSPTNSDVIAPSKVQVLVDKNGNVLSAILLPSNSATETAARFRDADELALHFASALRFAPAKKLTLGELIFNWRATPLISTNAAAP